MTQRAIDEAMQADQRHPEAGPRTRPDARRASEPATHTYGV
jgi:hypothetical protein